MFKTNYILVLESSKSYDSLANLIIIIAFVLLFLAVVVKYKIDEAKEIFLMK